jgi:VWFA-related protein
MKIKASLALLLVFSLTLPVLAQTTPTPAQTPGTPPPPPQKPGDDKDDVVRITTNLVQVDAVVTKDGKQVTNLTAEDFEIYQDGKKQTITSFAYITNVPNSLPPSQPNRNEKKTDLAPPTQIKREDPHRTIALVVDDLGLSFESMAQVRKQLRKFVDEQVQPNDLIAIIRTGGEMGALQQFTNDKRILGRAVDVLRWNYCSRVGIDMFPPAGRSTFRTTPACGIKSMTNSLRSLRFILDSMGQLPGRKSLVLLSDSLPRQSQDQFQQDRSVPRELEGSLGSDSSPLSTFYDDHSNFLHSLAEKAIRSSVVIYSVDTQGLPTLGITAADSFPGTSREVALQMQNLLTARRELHFLRQEGGDRLAKQTGGFQVRNTNNFELNRIGEDQAGYYLIGYRPTEETFNRKFHHIKAKVKRSGMNLRTRYGFFGVTEEDAKKAQPTVRDLTNLALASPFRAQDIEVDLTSFFAEEPSIGSMVRSFVYLDVKDLEFRKVNGKHQGSIEMHGAIFGDNGSLSEQMMRGATLNFTDSELEAAKTNGIGLGINMPVKRHGSYQIRIAVRDRHSSKIGSAGQFAIVPNLNDKKLGVSGIILGKLDQAAAQNRADQTVNNPGSRRFAQNSDLYYGYRIYNGAVAGGSQLRDLVMQAKLFRDGKSVFTGPEVPVIAGSQKDLTRVYVDGVVKLGPELEPGIYYLQVVIVDKNAKSKDTPVVQWVDFEIAR